MPALAITGGVGCGKSEVFSLLSRQIPSTLFSADQANRSLLDTDPEVKNEIVSALGSSCYKIDGTADRKRIADLLISIPSARLALEEILHSRLKKIWKPLADKSRAKPESFLIAEIPLIYEKKLQGYFDKIIVVACSERIRRERLFVSRGMSYIEFAHWISIQYPLEQQVRMADHVLWNDGFIDSLHDQTALLASILTSK